MSEVERGALLKVLGNDIGRELSARTVMFHQAIAERVGLSVTDHKCLDILLRAGPVTAGRLAELSGLTTGAVTGVVDRLERAGFVRRVADPRDRRRVIVEPVADKALREIGPLFESFRRAMDEQASRYSDEELAVVHRFVLDCIRILHEETLKLRATPLPRRRGRRGRSSLDASG